MIATQILADLAHLGIRIEARGDRLRYWPRSAMTPDLVEQMKAHKTELLAALRPENAAIALLCPWCKGPDLADAETGLRCVACDRIAWVPHVEGGLVRVDHIGDEEIDLPDPCEECDSLDLWQSVAADPLGVLPGRWRCQRCDPPETSRRMRGLATRSRARKTGDQQPLSGVDNLAATARKTKR